MPPEIGPLVSPLKAFSWKVHCVGNVLKSFVITLDRVVVSRFDSRIILDCYNVLQETAYNL